MLPDKIPQSGVTNTMNDSYNINSNDFTSNSTTDISVTDDNESCGAFKSIRDYRKKYHNNVILSFININSLTRAFSELSTLLSDNLVDVLSVAESKLDDC